MEVAAEITALEEHSGRAAGSDAERRAALHLRGPHPRLLPRMWSSALDAGAGVRRA